MAARSRAWPVGVLVALLAAGVAAAISGCTAKDAGNASSEEFPASARITAYLTGLAAAGKLSGAVLVTRGRMSYSEAFGFADRATRAPNTVHTEFRLGSVSKQFTAMGILLLQARHRLNVADHVCQFLSQCPRRWRAITLAELLCHTSGIPDYLNDLATSWPPRPASPPELIASFASARLHFRPGSRMRYSNSGYVLLGAVIEKVSGESLAGFLERNIFRPLGMSHTGTDTTVIRPGHARGYYAGGRLPVAYPMSAFFADGGLYSDVADMRRWDDAVDRSTLIPDALTRQMLTVHTPCPPPRSPGGCLRAADLGYGFGWFIDRTRYGPLFQHVGHIDGYFSFNGIYPAQDEDIVILANSEATSVLRISDVLASLTLGVRQ